MNSTKLNDSDVTILKDLKYEKDTIKENFEAVKFIKCVYKNRIRFEQTSFFKIEEIHSYERLLYLMVKEMEIFYDKLSIILSDVYLLCYDQSESNSDSDQDEENSHKILNLKVLCKLDYENFKQNFNLENSYNLYELKVILREEKFSNDEMQREAQTICDLFMNINDELRSFEMKKESEIIGTEEYKKKLFRPINHKQETARFIQDTFDDIKKHPKLNLYREDENFNIIFKITENSFTEWLGENQK